MKKLFLLLYFGCIFSANAQNETLKNAIGLRFGGGTGIHSELTYQHVAKKNNRFQVDLGYHFGGDYSGMVLAPTYQWVWPIKNNFYWFLGFGAVGGYWADNIEKTGGPSLGVTGIAGAEWRLQKIPLLFSFDARPEAYFLYFKSQPFRGGGALSLRYMF